MNGSTVRSGAAALMLLALGAAPPGSEPRPESRNAQYSQQMLVREQIIVRFPGRLQAAPPMMRWKEGRGPRCIPARMIAGAALPGEDSVDLILRDRSRMRARLDSSCPALDYYYGFYITPNADGMICAERDTIRSRMGGQCGIDRFRTLKPRRAD